MNKAEKSKIRTTKAIFLVIFILIAAAIGFKMYNPEVEYDVEFFSDDAKKQISLEIRNNQTEISDNVKIEGILDDEQSEKLYFVRVNNTKDVAMIFETKVISFGEGMAEALNMKIYDETHDKVLYEGSLKNADGKVFKENQVANAAKKNDTRYRINFYFDGETGSRYKNSEAEVSFKWFVPEDETDALKMSKSGDVRVILYSFIAMLVITMALLVLFRKRMNPEVFKMGETDGCEDEKLGVEKKLTENKDRGKKK